MTALLMKQMFEGAEEQGGVLTFDTGPVEDQGNISLTPTHSPNLYRYGHG